MLIKKILVPTDFSDDATNALNEAREFAKVFGAELLLLHVVEPIYYATPADMYSVGPNLVALMDEQHKLATKQLARISADLKAKRQRHRTILETGTPAHVITDTAKNAKADLIIMPTHGRTGLAHILMGSTAETVVRHASCPVLVIRRTGKAQKRATRKKS